jgi:hypothetical protein
MGSSKAKWKGGQLAFYDGTTYETTLPMAPRYLYDDFEGETLNTDIWLANDAGAATQTVADGTAILYLDATDEVQEADIGAAGNSLDWDISKGLIIEFRATQSVALAGQAEAHLGVLGESIVDDQQISSADDVAEHAVFSMDGSLNILINTDDGTNQTTAYDTTVDAVVGTYNIFRIDFTNIEDVRFYIDGADVTPAAGVDMSDIGSPLVQPAMICQKHGGAAGNLGTLTVDYVKIWQPTR